MLPAGKLAHEICLHHELGNVAKLHTDALLDAVQDGDLCRSGGRGTDARAEVRAGPDAWADSL